MNYYNENDPPTAAWLAQLIHDRLIPMGYVDERSITEVMPADLKGFTQCHFFAGIGGWSYALQLAGWPTTRPVWTGSCPCQPFSVAGKRKGSSDERHLWPEFYRLIKECKPSTVLESRLQARMAAYGSPEYVLTWKHWASGPPICALRASVRHISGKGSTGAAGWVTPNARDWKDTPGMSQTGVNPDGSIRKKIDQLPRQAAIAGVTTGSPVQTGKRGVLNPELPRWLMGYLPEWGLSGVTAMQSFRKSRQSLS